MGTLHGSHTVKFDSCNDLRSFVQSSYCAVAGDLIFVFLVALCSVFSTVVFKSDLPPRLLAWHHDRTNNLVNKLVSLMLLLCDAQKYLRFILHCITLPDCTIMSSRCNIPLLNKLMKQWSLVRKDKSNNCFC